MGTCTEKSCLNETVFFEHPKHMFKLMGMKIITVLGWKFLLKLALCLIVFLQSCGCWWGGISLFLMVAPVGLQCVIMIFPGHTHLLSVEKHNMIFYTRSWSRSAVGSESWTADPGVMISIARPSPIPLWRLIMKLFLWSFSSFPWFKKGCCKVCARSTG